MKLERDDHFQDHEQFQGRIDEMLVSGCSIEEERSLREHLDGCELCHRYLDASSRAIAGLRGFSFEVDPRLHSKVSASLLLRARQLEAAPMRGRRWVLICVVALVLTAAGSFLDLQFGGLIASLLDMKGMQVREGLIGLWIVPSICLCLLFPILPLLAAAGTDRTERNL